MTITNPTSRALNQDTGSTKQAAAGPVFITDQGKPANLLLAIEDDRRITGKDRKIADLLAMPGDADIELDLPPRTERAAWAAKRNAPDFAATVVVIVNPWES